MGKIERTGESAKSFNKHWIAYIRKEESRKIPYSDVLYIEQMGKDLYIRRDGDVLKIPGRMSEINMALSETFGQCHSYLMINFDRVDSMTKGHIVFDNEKELFIGRDSFNETRKKFNKYLLEL